MFVLQQHHILFEEQITPNLSFSFLALFHTNNDYAPWGGSDKRAEGVGSVGWREAMRMLLCNRGGNICPMTAVSGPASPTR